MGAMLRFSPTCASQGMVCRSSSGGELRSGGGVGRAERRQFILGGDSVYSGCSCGVASGPIGVSRRSSSRLASCRWSRSYAEVDMECVVVLGLGGALGMWRDSKATRRRKHFRRADIIVVRAGGDRDRNDNNSGEDQVETLFMKELRRRGMHTKGQDGGSLGSSGTDTKTKEDDSDEGGSLGRGWSLPGTSKTRPPQLTESQREEQFKRSMALNSEGLDGLIPRATELLKLGGTVFLAFWPLILATLASFIAVYLYFGAAFLHTGDHFERPARPPYVDPYQLLEEEVIPPQDGPDRVPYNFRKDSNSS